MYRELLKMHLEEAVRQAWAAADQAG
jgi:hypothetical protein